MLKAKNAVHPPLHLFVDVEGQGKKEYVFSSTFRVGRDEDCDLSIQHSHVSRHHLEMEFRDQCWWLHDLESTNGVFVNEKKVQHAPVLDKDVIVLGVGGPSISCTYISKEEANQFRAERREPAERSKLVYFVIAFILLGVVGFFYGKNELGKQERFREQALSLFTTVRNTNIAIAEVYAEEDADRLSKAQRIIELQKDRKDDLESYRGYLIRMGFYSELGDQIYRLIYSTASQFSENELTLPDAFVNDVYTCIQQYWLVENIEEYEAALNTAQFSNYTSAHSKIMREFGLPQEFFYLPLTISGFDSKKDLLSGFEPQAGAWKLSRASAEMYGLEVENPQEMAVLSSSANDDRYNFVKSTRASAKLLHDIYRKEAFASGLLTVALFLQYQEDQANGKEFSVGSLLTDAPTDIDSRNLWYIMERYPSRISREVYQDVVRIFAAAAIGQDPQLFNLDFTTPTATNLSSNIYRAFQ